ncbi:hypothetical protein KI387_010580, partial [Taxus chinensis]
LLRCGKSCRLRWINYLRSDLKRGNISAEEDELVIKLHGLLGNRWSLIAGLMQGRTDNEIKNYWNTHLSRKLSDRGIDPVTHKPFYYKFSTKGKKDTEPELSSRIESSTLLAELMKKDMKAEKPRKKKPIVITGTCKRKNRCHENGASNKKKASVEHLSSGISNQSSCQSFSDMNSDEIKLKMQSQDCNVSVQEKTEAPVLVEDEYPTTSLWEDTISSNILPFPMDFFGSFDTEDLIMFDNQLPESNVTNNNMEDTTDDLWSSFPSNIEDFFIEPWHGSFQ